MRKILIAMLALLAAFCACTSPATSPEPEPTIEILPVATPEPNYSYTTGLPTYSDYHPIAVMIENSAKARPQTGLNTADIVYETMAEGSITRFMAIFNDTIPSKAGPVRSARIYFIRILREWDTAPYIHVGGPEDSTKESYVYGSETKFIKTRINAAKGYNDYFWRSSDRKAPHNCYTSPQKVLEDYYDYTPKINDSFKFSNDVQYPGETVDTVTVPFLLKQQDYIHYKYDADKNVFLRFMGDDEFISEDNGSEAQVEVQNLIIQYTKIYALDGEIKDRRNVEVTGSGDAEFFVNGKHLKGKWSRPSLSDQTKYTLDDGSELILSPGNTWIHLHPKTKTITTTYI